MDPSTNHDLAWRRMCPAPERQTVSVRRLGPLVGGVVRNTCEVLAPELWVAVDLVRGDHMRHTIVVCQDNDAIDIRRWTGEAGLEGTEDGEDKTDSHGDGEHAVIPLPTPTSDDIRRRDVQSAR